MTMQGTDFPEANLVLGRPGSMEEEDCYSLPVCRGVKQLPTGERVPVVVSCWEPTDEEREAIANGAPVYLSVIGSNMPPASLSTEIGAETVPSQN